MITCCNGSPVPEALFSSERFAIAVLSPVQLPALLRQNTKLMVAGGDTRQVPKLLIDSERFAIPVLSRTEPPLQLCNEAELMVANGYSGSVA